LRDDGKKLVGRLTSERDSGSCAGAQLADGWESRMTDIAEGPSTTAVMSAATSFRERRRLSTTSDWIALQLVAGVTCSINLGASADALP
jgi:hypothetical protein